MTIVIVWLLVAAAIAVGYRYTVGSWVQERGELSHFTEKYQELTAIARSKGMTVPPLEDETDIDALKAGIADLKLALTGAKPLAEGKKVDVTLSLDAFSGYCVLRSDPFLDELRARGIQLKLKDDGADYANRMKALADGSSPMAVFTIDAILKASAVRGDSPATIVMLIDETTGADAVVAYKSAVPDIDTLNNARSRFVLTPDSPSETVSRVVMASFDLSDMSPQPWIQVNGAQEVLARFVSDAGKSANAYVLWEPYVSKALEQPGAHVLIDSSRFRGYIVDVLAVNREFLLKHEDVVHAVVEAYSRALYEYQHQANGLEELVYLDARKSGEPISREQAEQMVKGIWWKNTRENYAHMELLKADDGSLQSMDNMIRNIARVLVRTNAVEDTDLFKQTTGFYYDGILRQLQSEGFHPAIIRPANGDGGDAVRKVSAVKPLNTSEWSALVPVGTLSANTIVFARGTAKLTPSSTYELMELVRVMEAWPQYYLSITGSARVDGDMQANRQLAEDRARAAAGFLVENGVAEHRVQVLGTEPMRSDGKAQTVRFVVKQVPF